MNGISRGEYGGHTTGIKFDVNTALNQNQKLIEAPKENLEQNN